MVTPFLQEISGLRNNGEFFTYSSGQSYEEHQSTKGSWFPFASRSLEAPGRERPQPTPGILEISTTDVLTCTLTLNSGCSSLHINFVDVFFFIESLVSSDAVPLGPHPATLRDSCPRSLRSLLHDSSRQIDAYSSLNRFSSRSTNATISESPIATFNEH